MEDEKDGVACLGCGCDQSLGCLGSPPRGAAGCSLRQIGPAPEARTGPRRLFLELWHGAMHSAQGPVACCLTPISRSDDSHPTGACDRPLNLLFPAKSATVGPAERGAPSYGEGNALLVPWSSRWQGDTVPWGLGAQRGLLPPAGQDPHCSLPLPPPVPGEFTSHQKLRTPCMGSPSSSQTPRVLPGGGQTPPCLEQAHSATAPHHPVCHQVTANLP